MITVTEKYMHGELLSEISEIGIKVDNKINVLKELLLLGALTDM